MRGDPGFVPTLETETCAGKLAHFFPEAVPVRIPVRVTTLRASAGQLKENTLVEFVATDHAIFACCLPLEFDDRVRLVPLEQASSRKTATHAADATVIAVQYHEGRKAVAVRFLDKRFHWGNKP